MPPEADLQIRPAKESDAPLVLDFIRKLAKKTGCDILYDGMIAFSPEELTLELQPLSKPTLG